MPHEPGHEKRGFFGDVFAGLKRGVEGVVVDPLRQFGVLPPSNENQFPLPVREPLGAEADLARQRHAKSVASFMNRMLTQNLAHVNAQTATTNRTGGMRNQLINQTIQDTNFAAANIAGQGSLDIMRTLLNAQLVREQMDEARLFKQAEINIAGQEAQGQGVSDILQLLALIA